MDLSASQLHNVDGTASMLSHTLGEQDPKQVRKHFDSATAQAGTAALARSLPPDSCQSSTCRATGQRKCRDTCASV